MIVLIDWLISKKFAVVVFWICVNFKLSSGFGTSVEIKRKAAALDQSGNRRYPVVYLILASSGVEFVFLELRYCIRPRRVTPKGLYAPLIAEFNGPLCYLLNRRSRFAKFINEMQLL